MPLTRLTHRRGQVGVTAALAVTALAIAGCGSSSSSSSSSASGASSTSAATSTAASSGASTTASSSSSSSSGGLPAYTGPESKLPATYPAPKKTGKSITIGFANPTAQQESFQAMTTAMQKELAPLGAKLISKDDQLSVDKQTTDMEQLVAQKVDAIIVYPLDPSALGPALKQAAAAHIPVLGLDVTADVADPLPSGYKSQVLQGRDQQAYYQVQEMKAADPNGKIGLINIGSPVPALKYLLSREQYYAKQAGLDVEGVANNPTDDVDGGTTAAAGLLGKYSDMTGIIAYNDPSALGAVAAARTSGRQIKAIGLNGGSDGFEGVENGRIDGTVLSQSVKIGAEAAAGAYTLATGGTLPKRILVPDVPITKANVKSVPGWAQQLSSFQPIG
jgi:ribose transport system substrate-binding protein